MNKYVDMFTLVFFFIGMAQRHMRINWILWSTKTTYDHDGHKDYKCESCGKSFSQAIYLKKHIHTVHEGHKDYNCESCGKSFSYENILKRHTHTTHEGYKDNKCEYCGKLIFFSGRFFEKPYSHSSW